jgi:hypothetical protein
MALPFLDKKTYLLTLNSEDRFNPYTPTIATSGSSYTFTGSIATNQLTVTVVPSAGNVLGPGSIITGTGVTAGTYIISGTSSPYTVNINQTVASTTLTCTGLQSPYCNIYSSPSIPTGLSARNNATFNIDWMNFLPREYSQYKVAFNFQSTGGNYKDTAGSLLVYSTAKVLVNFGCKTFTYDTSSKSGSMLLGIVQRDIQTGTSPSNNFSCYYLWNPPKSIARPENNSLSIQIINPSNTVAPYYLYDTNTAGTSVAIDMTSYTAMLEFVPLDNEIVFN